MCNNMPAGFCSRQFHFIYHAVVLHTQPNIALFIFINTVNAFTAQSLGYAKMHKFFSIIFIYTLVRSKPDISITILQHSKNSGMWLEISYFYKGCPIIFCEATRFCTNPKITAVVQQTHYVVII